MPSGVSVRFFHSSMSLSDGAGFIFPRLFALGKKSGHENCVKRSFLPPCFCGIVNFTHTFPDIPHVYPHRWIESAFHFAQKVTYFLQLHSVSHTVSRFSAAPSAISTDIFTGFSPVFPIKLWITWITLRDSAPISHFSTVSQRDGCGKVGVWKGEASFFEHLFIIT